MQTIENLIDDIRTQMRRPAVSQETKAWANDRLREIAPQYRPILQENSYEDFVLQYIQQEEERFKPSEYRYTETGDDADFEREEALCKHPTSSSVSCPLQRGELPRELEKASTLDEGIRAFRRSHAGRPLVLEEAREEWHSHVGDVEFNLREVLAALGSDEIPPQYRDEPEEEEEEKTDDTDAEAEAGA